MNCKYTLGASSRHWCKDIEVSEYFTVYSINRKNGWIETFSFSRRSVSSYMNIEFKRYK